MSDFTHSSGVRLLDYDQLEPFAEIGFEDFRDILESMIEEAPVLIGNLEASMIAGDQPTGKAQAHSLRGMVLNFGCAALAAKIQAIEHSSPFPGGDAAQLGAELKSLWVRTQTELEGWAAAQSGASSA